MHPDSDNRVLYPNDNGKQQWGWNWLESWMASQPYHARAVGPNEGSYLTLATNDDVSVKTVEMDLVTPLSSDYITTGRLSGDSAQHSQSQRQSTSDQVPSYMASTQSAKAKVRAQNFGKHKGQPIKKPNGMSFDTSSSGGNVAYQIPRSPSPNPKGYGNGTNVVRGQSKWSTGYSPDSSGGDDGSMGRYGWINHFG